MVKGPALGGGTSDIDDATLIARARQGDEKAWAALVRRYERLIYAIPRRMKLSDDDAAEVFDAVFAELWRSLDRIEEPGRLNAWLATVTRRRSLAAVQHQRRWVSVPHAADAPEWRDLHDPAPMAETALLAAEREFLMRRAIQRLPIRCQRLFEWLFFTEPTPDYGEIARHLGLARNSIGFVRSRCLLKLREAWEEVRNEEKLDSVKIDPDSVTGGDPPGRQ